MLSMLKWKCLSSRQRIAGLFVGTITLLSGTDALAETTTTNTVSFEYDSVTGLLKAEVREPDNAQLHLRTEYTYDKYGNRLTTILSSNATGLASIPTHTARAVTYGMFGVSPHTVTNALGQTVIAQFDSSNFPTYIQALNGLASRFAYDPFGRKIQEWNTDGTQKKWEYLICGWPVMCPGTAKFVTTTTYYAPDGITVNAPWVKVYLDELERQVRTETVAFDGLTVIRADTEYDRLGRVARVSRPYYPNASIQWTATSYDELSRPLLVVAPDGAQTTMAYDGLTTVVTNALNQTQTTIKNGQGRVTQLVDTQGNTLTYSYDAQGNLLQTTDPKGNVITMSYDALGRKESLNDPDLGFQTYEHDALGRVRKQVDAKGNVTTLTYDVLGRMVGKAEADLVSSWTYDTCSMGKGRLCRATADNGYAVNYSFDGAGRPSGTTTTIDTAYTTTTTYDVNGRLATHTYPTGFAIKYVYSSLGYLKEVRDNATSKLYWQANAMDAEGHLLQQTHGTSLITQTVFDEQTGRVQNIHAGVGNAVQSLAYSYDALGNLLTRGDANQSLVETFEYDDLNRLTSNTVNSSGAGSLTQSYTYDNIGNITGRSDIGAYSYGSTGRPHAVATIDLPNGGVRSYDYDANGNLITEAERDSAGNILPSKRRAHSYTSFNMPSVLSNATASLNFVYGPDHQRIKQISPTGTTIYLHPDSAGGLLYEKEIKIDGSVEDKHFIRAAGGVVGLVKMVGTVRTILYFHRDHLGSTTAVTDQAGGLVERMAYEPFGKRRIPAGRTDPNDEIVGASTDRGYTNHEHLDELGLIHMNGRVYNPAIGRFTSADPYIPDPSNIQSFNRYSYTRNNPLMMTDPDGFQEALAGVCLWYDMFCRIGSWWSGKGGVDGGQSDVKGSRPSNNNGQVVIIVGTRPTALPVTTVPRLPMPSPSPAERAMFDFVTGKPLVLLDRDLDRNGVPKVATLALRRLNHANTLKVGAHALLDAIDGASTDDIETPSNDPAQPNENNLDKLPEKSGNRAAQDAGYESAHDAKDGRGDSKVNIYNDKTTGVRWLWDGKKGSEKEIL